MLSSYGQAHLQLLTEHEQPSRASLWGFYQAPDLQSGRTKDRAGDECFGHTSQPEK